MAEKATDSWLKKNFVGLLLGALGLAGSFVTIKANINTMENDIAQLNDYKDRVQKIERDFIKVEAVQDASKQYWVRFEELLKSNTNALNDNSIVMSGVKVQLDDHTRRIEKLEND
jgi:hypothetical protein